MARSLHTRPLDLRAADRVRRPRARRHPIGPRRRRRVRARLEPTWPLPRIVAGRPRPGFLHPLSRRQIARALRAAGELSVYGLARIELRQGSRRLEFARLKVPGRIVLFDLPPSPWRLIELPERERLRFERAGAEVEAASGVWTVSWPPGALRDFVLYEVLFHEIGHHLLEHQRRPTRPGRRPRSRAARTRDHEAFADRFVDRLRARRGRA